MGPCCTAAASWQPGAGVVGFLLVFSDVLVWTELWCSRGGDFVLVLAFPVSDGFSLILREVLVWGEGVRARRCGGWRFS